MIIRCVVEGNVRAIASILELDKDVVNREYKRRVKSTVGGGALEKCGTS